jgi:hypothetical protein
MWCGILILDMVIDRVHGFRVLLVSIQYRFVRSLIMTNKLTNSFVCVTGHGAVGTSIHLFSSLLLSHLTYSHARLIVSPTPTPAAIPPEENPARAALVPCC